MDRLLAKIEALREKTSAADKAKYAVLCAIRDFLAMQDVIRKVEKLLDDDAVLKEFLIKCAVGQRPNPLSDMKKMAEVIPSRIGEMDKALNAAKKIEKEKAERREKKRAAADATDPVAPVLDTSGDNTIQHVIGRSSIPVKSGRKLKAKITKEMREQIWEAYMGNCAKGPCPVCQKREIRMTDFSAGHIIAEACGGPTDVSNLMPICGNCNSRMRTENLFEYAARHAKKEPEKK
jgi:5-methylcytosine-specific restriction endonuclease McrA